MTDPEDYCKKAIMGMCPISKMSRFEEEEEEDDEYKKLVHKMRLLQQEIALVMSLREEENKAYERGVLAFTFKEAEWRKERKTLREEIKRLQRKEDCCKVVDKEIENEKDGYIGDCCVEKMRQERARRDEAVEKWKMLYLAIKAELDDLIQRTAFQGGLYWREEEEEFMEEIQKEINAKDETIVELQAQVVSMEEEEYKRKREVDILRQSLRILCSKKKVSTPIYGC